MTKLPENCPVCGEKMEKEYVMAIGKGVLVRWRNSEVHRGIEKLGSGWASVDLGGVRCPNCKIVLFGYGEEQKKE